MQWSEYQEAIFKAVSDDTRSLLVEAVAGSGKTTTLVELIQRIPRGQRTIFLAFNKKIATELERRVDRTRAQCKTLHAVGLQAWKTYLDWDANNCDVDGRKTFKIIDEKMTWPQKQRYGQMSKLIAIAKGAGIVPLLPEFQGLKGLADDDLDTWEELIDFYDLEQFVSPSGEVDEAGIDLAREVLAEGIRQARDVIDYDDMLYMPVVMGAKFEQYDVVLLDEAQDVNAMQVEIVERMVRPGGRVIAVGDKHQAIYGFRGCLSESMAHIGQRFKAMELPLSISYRCPKKVIAEAQRYVGHILPFEHAPDGIVESPESYALGELRASDVILCRLNAPLIALAFHLIRSKVPCKIEGRDIATGLTALVKKMKATDVNDLLRKLSAYREREEIKAKGDPGKLSRVEDKLSTIYVFIDELSPSDTVDDLMRNIEGMFSDQTTGILTLSTVHKAKGLEWERVFILDFEDLMPLPWAKDGWQLDQEYNLCYVAITRSKAELRYVTSEGLGLPVKKKKREREFVPNEEEEAGA